MNKRGMSDIITNVLIILLVLVAIGIVWSFVAPTLRQASSGISAVQFESVYDVVSASVVDASPTVPGNDQVRVVVRRGSGGEEPYQLRVILQNNLSASNSFSVDIPAGSFSELEAKEFVVDYTSTDIANPITKVLVVPAFLSGTTVVFGNPSEYAIGSSSSGSGSGGSSCGNGVLESGEQCDSGSGNSIIGACTPSCTTNVACTLLNPRWNQTVGIFGSTVRLLVDASGNCLNQPVVFRVWENHTRSFTPFNQDAVSQPSNVNILSSTFAANWIVEWVCDFPISGQCVGAPDEWVFNATLLNSGAVSVILPLPGNLSVSSRCQDGVDNDGDTLIDSSDPGCTGQLSNDNDESPVNAFCGDGICAQFGEDSCCDCNAAFCA